MYIPSTFYPEGYELMEKSGYRGNLVEHEPGEIHKLFPGCASFTLDVPIILRVRGEQILVFQGIGGVIAREQSALAIVSFFVLVLIMSLVFKNAFEHRPWREQSQPAQGFSVIAFSAMLAVIAFAIFIHPHFGVLYLPWQEYTAAYPWWQPLTQTLHGNFSIGLIMSYPW